MATPSLPLTDRGLRCPVHHQAASACRLDDLDLADTLAALQAGGTLIVDTDPTLLGYCNSHSDCVTEQAVVTIRTTGRERGDALFTSWHDCCAGCLSAAVTADERSGFRVEIHVPSHTAGAAA
jgi:hypothetical protein